MHDHFCDKIRNLKGFGLCVDYFRGVYMILYLGFQVLGHLLLLGVIFHFFAFKLNFKKHVRKQFLTEVTNPHCYKCGVAAPRTFPIEPLEPN